MALTQVSTGMIADGAITSTKLADGSTTYAKLASDVQGGDEGGVTTLNVGITDRSNFRSTRSFFPLLNGTVQGTNIQYNVYATQWTAEIEL